MKFKHFLSAALALVMTLSLSIPVFAADYETSVSYEGTGTEQYELTVPSQLKPGTSGNVTLSGTWASNRHIAVTADEIVAMTGSLGGSETLDVTFAGIDLAGNNETSVSETKRVSVEDLNALFGTWTGTFYYNVGASNVGNTTVDTDSGSSSSGGGITNPDGSSSPSDPLAGVDLSQATAFTVTSSNRAAVGYTGERNENLVIPAYFVGDGENGTTAGQVYKVTKISAGAFYRCTLASVTIPEGVTSIESGVFTYSKLTSINIPESITSIEYKAFDDCSSLTSINVNAQNNNYSSDDGVLFNKDKTVLVRCPEGKREAYTIPSSVTSIGKAAFRNCINLTSITIPEGVASIGDYVFQYCRLTGITIPEGVTSIGKGAFANCSKLTSIAIPEGVTSIRNYAFANCDNLTSIAIPEGVTSIGEGAFRNCTNLTNITIPEGVTSIGDSAFYDCSNLTNITIPEGVTSIGTYTFTNCSGLERITFNGTQEQWNAISKGNNWNSKTGSYTIYCTNGNIAK